MEPLQRRHTHTVFCCHRVAEPRGDTAGVWRSRRPPAPPNLSGRHRKSAAKLLPLPVAGLVLPSSDLVQWRVSVRWSTATAARRVGRGREARQHLPHHHLHRRRHTSCDLLIWLLAQVYVTSKIVQVLLKKTTVWSGLAWLGLA